MEDCKDGVMSHGIPCSAADLARRASKFQPLARADSSRREVRVPHPDAPAQLKGDPQKKLLAVVRARLEAGEEVSPYQQSLLQTYGLTLADLRSPRAGKEKKRVESSSTKGAKGSAKRKRAEECPVGGSGHPEESVAEVAAGGNASGSGSGAAAAPSGVSVVGRSKSVERAAAAPPEGERRVGSAVGKAAAPAAAEKGAQRAKSAERKAAAAGLAAASPPQAPSLSGIKHSVASLKKLAQSLERLRAKPTLSRAEEEAVASLPSIYDRLMELLS